MLRKFVKKILPKSDTEKLLLQAENVERYKPHSFEFRNMKFQVTDFRSVAWQLKEFFDDGRMEFVSKKQDPIIYDCGSNVGVSILYYKSIYPLAKVKAFEPDKNVVTCLKKNLQANKIDDVEVIEEAVWVNNNGIEFGSEGADGGSVFFTGNKISLPSIRLKDLLEKESKIDLLKMDIEGAEVEVLSDCADQLAKIKFLFVEYHSWKNQPQQLDILLKLLNASGFRYTIQSIGSQEHSPFMMNPSDHSMDIQLDIHAINEHFND